MERENTCMVSLQFDISILAVTVALVLKLVLLGIVILKHIPICSLRCFLPSTSFVFPKAFFFPVLGK